MKSDTSLVIDSTEYEIHNFMATEGLTLAMQLAKIVGPVIAPFATMSQDTQVTGDMMQQAVNALVKNLDSSDTVLFIKKLLNCVHIKGVGNAMTAFDVHFIGNLSHLPKLLRAIIDHNFSDFFGSLGDLLPELSNLTA